MLRAARSGGTLTLIIQHLRSSERTCCDSLSSALDCPPPQPQCCVCWAGAVCCVCCVLMRNVKAASRDGMARPLTLAGHHRAGARHHGLDPAYVSYLDSLPSYDSAGWGPVLGRAAAAAVAAPLAAPLLPPLLALRLVRQLTEPSATSGRAAAPTVGTARSGGAGSGTIPSGSDSGGMNGRSGGVNGRSGSDSGSDSNGWRWRSPAYGNRPSATAGVTASPVAAPPAVSAALRQPVAAASQGSGSNGAGGSSGVGASRSRSGASSSNSSSIRAGSSSPRASSSSGGGGGNSFEVPPALATPSFVLPATVGAYFAAVQSAAWGLHDLVAAPLLGSGSGGAAPTAAAGWTEVARQRSADGSSGGDSAGGGGGGGGGQAGSRR